MSTLIPPEGALRTWIELYGPQTEAPDEAHLGVALALISAAIGWKAWIRWGENAEPCTVNVVLEGRSAAARKTTVAGSAHSLAREAMHGIDEEDRGLTARSVSHTSSRGLLETVAAADTETAQRWEDQPPPGHLLVWDEFGQVLGKPGEVKGADWLGQVRTAVMQLTNGRHGGIQTGAAKAPPGRCAVSILATLTRAELEQRVSTGLLRDGFMGRFILIPFAGRQRLLPEPPNWTPGMAEQRRSLVAWLRELAQADTRLDNIFARLEPDARRARADWYERWVTGLETQAEDATEGSAAAVEAFGRLQTTALKVAAVDAIGRYWQPGQSLAKVPITAASVAYGQALAEICLREVIDLGREGGLSLRDVYAERVKTFLARRGPVSKKELLDSCRLAALSRRDRWWVVEDLHPEDVELIRVDTGGRPRIIVRLTPTDAESAAEVQRNGGAKAHG